MLCLSWLCRLCLCADVFAMQIPDYALESGYADQHCFMPSYPICRALPSFKADKGKANDGKACNKYSSRHAGLTPGILTLFCAHKTCLGFTLLANPEGPSSVFNILYTRFQNGRLFLCVTPICNTQGCSLAVSSDSMCSCLQHPS